MWHHKSVASAVVGSSPTLPTSARRELSRYRHCESKLKPQYLRGSAMDRVRLSLYWPSRVSGFARDMKTTILYVPVPELA